MTVLAERIAAQLRAHQASELSAPALALAVNSNERSVRRCIADEAGDIQRAAGGLICSKPGKGFWICTDADQIIARHHLLTGLHAKAQDKLAAFEDAVRAFGLAGVLRLSKPSTSTTSKLCV